jgi:plastocyanin
VHALALQLAPVLAAEKSKTPFYIVGGLLVVWAFALSLGIGTLRPAFPTNSRGERLVIAITAVLVAGTLGAAVATSGSPTKTEQAKAAEAAVTAKIAREVAAPEPSPPGTPPAPAATSEAPAAPSATESTTTTTSRTPAKAAPAVSNPSQPTPNHTKLALSVPGAQLAYNTKLLTSKAGAVTITMTNMSPIEHNVTIAEGTKVLGATPTFTGGTKAVTLNLKPGKYTFYCSVPGHRQAGMEGTLVVK